MTNAQSRFNDTKIDGVAFWMLNALTSNGGRQSPDWKWNSSRQAFVNKWGREVRCAAAAAARDEVRGCPVEVALQRDIRRRAVGDIVVASVPSVQREEAKALWREWTVEEEKKALRLWGA